MHRHATISTIFVPASLCDLRSRAANSPHISIMKCGSIVPSRNFTDTGRRKFESFEFPFQPRGRYFARVHALPVRFTYAGSRSIVTSQLVSRARTRRSRVRPVTVNKSSCAPHRPANRSSPRRSRSTFSIIPSFHLYTCIYIYTPFARLEN